MKKTILYKDISTGEVCTLEKCKQKYAEANNSDLPIDDYDMEMILHEQSWQLGGNVQQLNDVNDSILNWCNRYADVMEAERYLSQTERDDSVYEIYQMIQMCMVDDMYMHALPIYVETVMDFIEPERQALLYELINLTKGET